MSNRCFRAFQVAVLCLSLVACSVGDGGERPGSATPTVLITPTVVAMATATSTWETGTNTTASPPSGLSAATEPRMASEAATAASPDPWAQLRRPLRLPMLTPGDACPRGDGAQLGSGPTAAGFVSGTLDNGRARRGNGWYYHKVLWRTGPERPPPLLIRGRQLDGPGEVRFGEGRDPALEFRYDGSGATEDGTYAWSPYTRVRAPGCYAYQIDGANFSEVIVFAVVQPIRWEDLHPLPPITRLPQQLEVVLVSVASPGRVWIALDGPPQADGQRLEIRLEAAPTSAAPPELPGTGVRRDETAFGTVLSQADPLTGPYVAAWDDGRYRYRLEVLGGALATWPQNGRGTWTQADLLALVEAFASPP